MSLKKSLDELLNKEMDRKEFLGHIGGMFLVAVGATNLAKLLAEPKKTARKNQNLAGPSYSSGAYGGKGKS